MKDLIPQIKERLDILEVAEKHLSLKKVGKEYFGLCPFHSEKTPSFSISQEKGVYYCFGCQATGDAIDLYCRLQGVDFKEAISDLSDKMGLSYNLNTERTSFRKSIRDINNLAADQYVKNLQKNKTALNYIEQRGLSQEIAALYKIGFAFNSWGHMTGAIRSKGLALENAIKTGLLGRSKTDRIYDRFRNRIMFPIQDLHGEIVGFGGRTLGEDKPKYLNSNETEIFKKRDCLYGFWQARQAIVKAEKVLLTEGYLDVISLYQHGFENVCGLLGTSLTDEQISKLSRIAQRVILLFDSDQAGQKAAFKNAASLLRNGLEVYVCILPEGEDPDSYVHKNGEKRFQALLDENSVEGVQFCIKTLQKYCPKKMSEWLRNFLSNVSDSVVKSSLVTRVSSLLDLSPAELTNPSFPLKNKSQTKVYSVVPFRDKEIIEVLLLNPSFILKFKEFSGIRVVQSEFARCFIEKIIKYGSEENLLFELTDEERKYWYLYKQQEHNREQIKILTDDIERLIKKKDREAYMQNIYASLQQATESGNQERVYELLEKVRFFSQ